MSLDKAKISEGIKQNMTCKKEGHQNRLIEFVCLAPNCSSRLLCTNCLLNDHSEHFKDIILLEIFIKQENNQNKVQPEESESKEQIEESKQTSSEIKKEITQLLQTIKIEDFQENYDQLKNQDYDQLKIIENAFEKQSKVNQETISNFSISVQEFFNNIFAEIQQTYTQYQDSFSNVQTQKLDTKEKLMKYLEDYCKGEINFYAANPIAKLKQSYKLLFYLSLPNLNFIKQHEITQFQKFQEEINKIDSDEQFENFQMFTFHRARILKRYLKSKFNFLQPSFKEISKTCISRVVIQQHIKKAFIKYSYLMINYDLLQGLMTLQSKSEIQTKQKLSLHLQVTPKEFGKLSKLHLRHYYLQAMIKRLGFGHQQVTHCCILLLGIHIGFAL